VIVVSFHKLHDIELKILYQRYLQIYVIIHACRLNLPDFENLADLTYTKRNSQ